MPCKWERFKRVHRKLAIIVASGGTITNASGVGGLVVDTFVRVPSPRLQCQVSLLALLDTLPSGIDPVTDAGFVAPAAGNGWNIYPIVELLPEDGVKNIAPSVGLTEFTTLRGVLGDGMQAPIGAGGDNNVWGAGYTISGEVNRLWLVRLNGIKIGVTGTPTGQVALLCDFAPHPASGMSAEEWAYWQEFLTVDVNGPSGDTAPKFSPT